MYKSHTERSYTRNSQGTEQSKIQIVMTAKVYLDRPLGNDLSKATLEHKGYELHLAVFVGGVRWTRVGHTTEQAGISLLLESAQINGEKRREECRLEYVQSGHPKGRVDTERLEGWNNLEGKYGYIKGVTELTKR